MTQFIFIAYFPSAFLLAPISLIFCVLHLCLSILSNERSEKIEHSFVSAKGLILHSWLMSGV